MLKDGNTDRKGTERRRRRSPRFEGQQTACSGREALGAALPSAHLHAGAEQQHTEETQQCFSESPELANHLQRTIYSSHSHLISVHKQTVASVKFLLARNYAAIISAPYPQQAARRQRCSPCTARNGSCSARTLPDTEAPPGTAAQLINKSSQQNHPYRANIPDYEFESRFL